MRRFVSLAFALVCACASAAAAQQAQYRPQADTTYVQAYNPFRMYWVRGADTIGTPQRELSVERVTDEAEGARVRHTVRMLILDTRRQANTTVYDIDPSGRVALQDGKAPGWSSTVDLLLHLPQAPLAAGTTWADTVEADSAGSAVPLAYRVTRSYRVQRMIDTLGSRVAEIAATGTVRFAAGFRPDSAGQFAMWMDASGPVAERYLFDVGRGRMLYRRWDMDLRGRGTLRREDGGLDTLPAGLLSIEERREVPAAFARLLARDLPGADTMVTVTQTSTLLLHTSRRAAGEVTAGLARNDGMVGTATLRHANGAPESFEALWTDTSAVPRRFSGSVAGGRLVVHGPAGETSYPVPAGAWAVADYGFEEMLAPVLLATPGDTATLRIAVFRPVAAKWDTVTADLRRVDGATVAALTRAGAADRDMIIVDGSGVLLFEGNRADRGIFRVPRLGSAAVQRLKEVTAAMQQAAHAAPQS